MLFGLGTHIINVNKYIIKYSEICQLLPKCKLVKPSNQSIGQPDG